LSNLPDFDQQFGLDLTTQQRELLYKYKPLSADCSESDLQDFLLTKDTPIDQCQFCPENLIWHTALGEHKANLEKPNFPPPVTEQELKFYR